MKMTKVLEFWAVEKNIINENCVYIGRAVAADSETLKFPRKILTWLEKDCSSN